MQYAMQMKIGLSLAEKPLSSLDALTEPEAERLWLMEAQRLYAEIAQGLVALVSAEEGTLHSNYLGA